ncbi:hypothetical protein SAMN04488544_1638 [Microlunatus sagamiharensis]|uniref:Alkaline shock response membrane anchor protein AmaP n=1 Tax=Microlunatus sagamiharensis TaxID=546874 RepID=A0A1H2M9Q4_9ACTN|nr:hypothetical protein [Microlunatus sagamiharensis]SDU89834.1 hypothetical protein SAMN04488544_1638 [Microlunatus sagamiharensis]
MRQTAARLNRTWLTVLGLVLVVAGAAGLLLATGAAAPLLQRTGGGWTPPDTGRRLFGDATATAFGLTWVVVVTALVGLVLALLGIAWLLAQIPRKHEAKPFRLHDEAGTGLTRLDPGVLADAVETQAKTLPGVTGAAAVIRGSAAAPELTLRLTVDDRTSVPDVLGLVHREVAGPLATSLDTRLRRLAVQVEVGRAHLDTSQVSVPVGGTTS